jgi:2-iminobutanoate/2-iminopropanoate deaminase
LKTIMTFGLALGLLGGCVSVQNSTPAPTSAIQTIKVPGAHTLGPYSKAIRAGDFVFLSGVIAFDAKAGAFVEATIEPQTRQVFANISQVLAAANLSLNDVVKTTVFLKNPKDFAAMNAVYAEYFLDNKPARSTVPGMDWGRPEILIEIDVVAYAPRP